MRGDGVSDDLVGVAVLDRTQVQLALTGGMLGDIGQPLGIWCGGGEIPAHEVVVHRRPRLTGTAFLLGVQREDLLHRADPPHPVLRRGEAPAGEFVGDEPVPVGWVVSMDLERRVDQMRVIPVALADRGCAPLVVGLPGDAQHPARHRDRHPDRGAGRGQFTDERERYFPGKLPCAR